MTETPTKRCQRCGETKPLDDFHRDRRADDGRVRWCRKCMHEYRVAKYASEREAAIAYAAEWKRRNPEKMAEYGRRRRYGVEPQEFAAMLDEQDGACAICGQPHDPAVRARALRVDHDHATDAIRGLLCDGCNRGVGFLGDTLDRLRAAVAYLERDPWRP